MTVEEYMSHELASDSDDSTKMHQAENRATKERKLAFPRNNSSTFSSAAQLYQSNLGSPTPPYTGNQFWNVPFSSQRQRWTLYNQITSSDFKTPLSKLEVNPKKTDKTDADIKEFIKEHPLPHIDINDSYLEKVLRDHALSEIQNTRGAKTKKS